jgi:ribosome-binding factor A
MSHPREERVADRIQAELADILQFRLKTPRRGLLTVTAVEVTRDLRQARVFVSSLTEEDLLGNLSMLERARGFLRRELGRRVRLRHTPELLFFPDHSAEHGLRVARILDDLRRKGELTDNEGEE